ncbi:hypothetical protein ADIS_2913 [Lunatimonas lonarensis]|uniref:Uncharacterized protein n=1 Tax=Lunatimonas lonarensis TaxID=1232681 RepID=R7ZQY1_9BACT|nr:hypothetical protein [Lunatimonas lonarensis]EON76463.1 hypothetical protein ADIS_2913 [Lunatimonas lonarensis]
MISRGFGGISDISIDNRIDLYPLTEGGSVYPIDEKDSIFIFNNNCVVKLGLKPPALNSYHGRPAFDDWVSYVIHAGICLLNTSKKYLNAKIGIGLKDYYQNYHDFSSIIPIRKVRFLYNGRMGSKSISIRGLQIFPNLFGQANWISNRYGINRFVVLSFGMDCLEGLYFEQGKPFLSQRYVLGPGFSELVRIQNTEPFFETNNLSAKLTESKVKMEIEHEEFYNQFLKKKIEFICRSASSIPVFYIKTSEVSQEFHGFLYRKLGGFGKVTSIADGANASAHGLASIKMFRKSNLSEEVSISVFPDHTTFVL